MRFLYLLVIACMLPACGYHFPGTSGDLPGNVKKLYIPLFVNQTSEPRVEYDLTNRVSEVFARNSTLSLVEQEGGADAVLAGRIVGYSNRASAYDASDNISEYRSTMTIEVELMRNSAERERLWQKRLAWSTDYSADPNKMVQEDREGSAIAELSLRLAEELSDQMINDF